MLYEGISEDYNDAEFMSGTNVRIIIKYFPIHFTTEDKDGKIFIIKKKKLQDAPDQVTQGCQQ